MTTNIIQLFPQPTPTPPLPPAVAAWYAQRERENVDYEWRVNMSRMYPATLPVLIPYWYPRKKTMLYAYDKHPLPVDTVADVRAQLDKNYRRLGLVAAADAQDIADTATRKRLAVGEVAA